MLKWIGTIAGIVGAILVAANSGYQFVGYLAFFAGSIAWLIVSLRCKDRAGMVQWAFFSAVNLWGLLNYAN